MVVPLVVIFSYNYYSIVIGEYILISSLEEFRHEIWRPRKKSKELVSNSTLSGGRVGRLR